MIADVLSRYRHHQIGRGQTVFEIRINDATVAELPDGTLGEFAVCLDGLLDSFFGGEQ